MARTIEIHISDVKAYRTCRRQWEFSSLLMRGLEPVTVRPPLFFGKAAHYVLQEYYENGTPVAQSIANFVAFELHAKMLAGLELWPEENEIIVEQVALLADVMKHYVAFHSSWEANWSDKNLEFIALETAFNIPLLPDAGINFSGRFDGVVKHKSSNTFWLFETKTCQSIKRRMEQLDFDDQSTAYLYAAEQIVGQPLEGILYNLIRKKSPTEPRVLQNGTLSVNQNIDTTYAVYWRAIQELHGDDWKEELPRYQEILDTIERKEWDNPFFVRVPVAKTRSEMLHWKKRFEIDAMEMAQYAASTPETYIIASSPDWYSCGWCAFKSPCLQIEKGEDPQDFLDALFTQRREWDTMSGKEEDNG